MKPLLTAVALGGLLAGIGRAALAERDSAKPIEFSVWMDVKVTESQKVFAALAEADFAAILQSTEKLKTLSGLEGFVRRSTPGYRTQLRLFEFAVQDIEEQSRRANIEGVALGFNQLTLSCVNCHKQLRRPAPVEEAARASER